MPSRLRLALLAWIAACQVYLFAHSQEPLRLDIGDPWSDANVLCSINYVKQYGFLETSFTDILDVGPLTEDSYRYTHYPPLAEITYGTLGKLGVDSIGIYRIFALLFSAGAMAMLFLYARRMWGETIALVATALWQGSLLWLLYADSIHQAPIFQLTTFFGLWGLERAIATKHKKFYAVAIAGAFGCFLTSYDGWIFFPAAVLVTTWVKAGNPFARGNRHLVALCAGGCVAAFALKSLFVMGAIGWDGYVADLHLQFLERTGSGFDRGMVSAIPTMTRRLTQVFSPLLWITVVCHGLALIRARTLASIRDGVGWLLCCALAFWYIFPELAASQMLPSQVMLPFYAIGSAAIIAKLLARAWPWKIAGYAWLLAAAAWGAGFMISIPRSVMRDDDVTAVREYLHANDHNDFILNNLRASGQIQWAYDRHDWSMYDGTSPEAARRYMLDTFAQTNTSTVTAVVYKTYESRLVDKTLWPLALPTQQWSVTGMPFIWTDKAKALIDTFDHNVLAGLTAVDAVRVLTLHDVDVYRVDRKTVVDRMMREVQPTTLIDLTGTSSEPNQIYGWSEHGDGQIVKSYTCGHPGACKTVLGNRGLSVLGEDMRFEGRLFVRFDKSCDASLQIRTQSASELHVRFNEARFDFADLARQRDMLVPQISVHAGLNELVLSYPMESERRRRSQGRTGIATVTVSCK